MRPGHTGPPTSADPLDAWYAAIRSGDPSALADAVTPDVHIAYRGRPGPLPWTGDLHGVASTREFLARVTRHLEVLEVTPLRRIRSGDTVVGVLSGRWRARATGREVAAEVVNIFAPRQGRVAAHQVFHDTTALREALRGETPEHDPPSRMDPVPYNSLSLEQEIRSN